MTAVKYSVVYRSGAAAGAPVPSMYTCVNVSEITSPIEGDFAYDTTLNLFKKFDGVSWSGIEDSDLVGRINMLEFLVACIIQKGFGGF
jgi:hypothetical protein